MKKFRFALLLLFLFDALAFLWLIFRAVETNLLWREGLYGPARAILLEALCLALIVGLHLSYEKIVLGDAAPRRRSLILEIAIFFFLTVPPSLLTFITPEKGKPDFAWLPLEWHKIPENIILLAKIDPVFFACEIAAVVLLIHIFCVRHRRFTTIAISGALFALVFRQLFILSKESNLIFYFFQYASMPLLAFIAALLKKPRLFARAGIAASALVLLMWQYIGVVPFNARPEQLPDAALTMIYPRPGEQPAFPLVFFRDFYVDARRNTLFTAYGPTSGLVRLKLDTGEVKVEPTHAGLVRYLWTRDDLPVIYAIDWIRCDLLIIDKEKFTVERRDIYRPDASIPLALEVVGDRLYVTTTERPGLTEYDLKTMRILRRLDLLPYTSFRSGVWRMAYDPRRNALFIELGYTDLNNANKLIRVPIDTRLPELKPDAQAEIPAGGLELLAMPDERRIISASFFTTSLWEFDMDSMKFLRRIEGPINCRNMAYDPRRRLIYATSFLGGTLHVIRQSDGQTIKKIRLGNKASSLFLSPEPEHKTLYLGNSWGVMKLDLDKFLQVSGGR